MRTDETRGRSELVRSFDSLAWPTAAEAVLAPSRAPAAASGADVQAGSVESLVGGLESRLAAQPNDANGWALLAQSYAYTANAEAGERAIRRAVELGVDEQLLRERVAIARRSVHAGNGLFATTNGIELPLLNGATAAALAFSGPGSYSLDAALGLIGFWTPELAVAAIAIGILGAIGNLAVRRPAVVEA